MPGPMPRAPRQFHRWLIRSAIGVFSLLTAYEVFAFFSSGRDPVTLVIAGASAGFTVGLFFYLGWFMRRSAEMR
jgi:hypothetical protein